MLVLCSSDHWAARGLPPCTAVALGYLAQALCDLYAVWKPLAYRADDIWAHCQAVTSYFLSCRDSNEGWAAR